jgi:VCBS repeat-containing protein
VSDEYNTLEGFDHPLEVSRAGGVLQNDRDPEGRQLTAALTSGPQHGRVTLRADGSFTYTPEHDWFGDDHFSYRATDDAGSSSTAVVTIHVQPINDWPRFRDRGSPPPVGPGAGTQTIPNWAYDINPGNMETNQTVEFIVTGNSNPGLFTSGGQPAVSNSGTLTYTPSGQTGSATITVVPHDNGGRANGGSDTGEGHTFTITVR